MLSPSFVLWAVGRKRPPLCRGCAPATPPSGYPPYWRFATIVAWRQCPPTNPAVANRIRRPRPDWRRRQRAVQDTHCLRLGSYKKTQTVPRKLCVETALHADDKAVFKRHAILQGAEASPPGRLIFGTRFLVRNLRQCRSRSTAAIGEFRQFVQDTVTSLLALRERRLARLKICLWRQSLEVLCRECRRRRSLVGTLDDTSFTLQIQQGFTDPQTADIVIQSRIFLIQPHPRKVIAGHHGQPQAVCWEFVYWAPVGE